MPRRPRQSCPPPLNPNTTSAASSCPPAAASRSSTSSPSRSARCPREHARDLHVCPDCDAHLVYPVEWEEHDAIHWEVSLRCPNCEWHGVDLYAQDVVDRFDEELDRGTEALVRDLKRLTRANMEDEIERFRAALEADAILPEDF